MKTTKQQTQKSTSATSASTSSSSSSSSSSGPPTIIKSVGPCDILCGRCKDAFNNVGNRRFRITMGVYLDEYLATTSKKETRELIVSIVQYLQGHIGIRFLKPVKGRSGEYMELGEREAREKVGHALRDLAVTRNQVTMAQWKQAQKKRNALENSNNNNSTTTSDLKGVKVEQVPSRGVAAVLSSPASELQT